MLSPQRVDVQVIRLPEKPHVPVGPGSLLRTPPRARSNATSLKLWNSDSLALQPSNFAKQRELQGSSACHGSRQWSGGEREPTQDQVDGLSWVQVQVDNDIF